MNYSGYNPLLPQQQQQHSYEYDPSQIQPYDQSYPYQPYYAADYNHQYPYYLDNSNNYQQSELQYQPEPSPVHPPGVNPEPIQPRPNRVLLQKQTEPSLVHPSGVNPERIQPRPNHIQLQKQTEPSLVHSLGVNPEPIQPRPNHVPLQKQTEPSLVHPPGVNPEPIQPSPNHVPLQKQTEPSLVHPPGANPELIQPRPNHVSRQYRPKPSPVHPPVVNPERIQPRPNHDPTAPSQFRGRGGRSFRRGGCGRGRGVSAWRHFPSHSSGPAISDALGAPAAAGAASVAQSLSSVSGQTTLPKPVQPPPRRVFCEICKIECNSPEIMEMHKNGKKHQKNMKVHEMMQRHNAVNELQSGQIPTPQLNSTDQLKKVQDSEDKICPTINISSEISADNHKDEIKLANNVGETTEVAAEEHDGTNMENTAARGRGLKRKMKGGKGPKSKRSTDGSKEALRAEQAIAFTCEVCNVKCDSHVVYQSHVTGKKHLKRVHGHQALSGAVGLQAVYPPDINALANAINAQVQQGDNDPQVLLAQLLVNVLSQAQGSATAPLNGPMAAQTPTQTPVAGSSCEPQLEQTQVSEIQAQVGMENPGGESKSEMLSVPVESNVLSQAQGSATALLLNGPLAAQTPTQTPVAGSSCEPQLAQTQVSEIPAQVGMENPGGESKSEMLSVPVESNALEGSSVSAQIEGGSSEAK